MRGARHTQEPEEPMGVMDKPRGPRGPARHRKGGWGVCAHAQREVQQEFWVLLGPPAFHSGANRNHSSSPSARAVSLRWASTGLQSPSPCARTVRSGEEGLVIWTRGSLQWSSWRGRAESRGEGSALQVAHPHSSPAHHKQLSRRGRSRVWSQTLSIILRAILEKQDPLHVLKKGSCVL